METVKWSCDECGESDEMNPGDEDNPYRLGLAIGYLHKERSPQCNNLLLNFDPIYIIKEPSLDEIKGSNVLTG